jgi:predicted small integral membrane protein
MLDKGDKLFNTGRLVIGPFQFLAISLISSEYILLNWMSITSDSEFTERIVAGAFLIAVLIAVLVVFCVVYLMKKRRGDDF